MFNFLPLFSGAGTELDGFNEDKHADVFKGLFYELSPLTITLTILVILQNVVVAWDNFKRRETMAPWLFTGIAVGDILFAQGLFILSLISILVYRGVLEERALYKAQGYFMITALPGLTCSKLYNVILSVTLSFNLADPFRVLNTRLIKLCTITATGLIACLHLSDAICFLVVYSSLKVNIRFLLVDLVMIEPVTGFTSAAILVCMPFQQDGSSRCVKATLNKATVLIPAFTILILDYVIPVIVVLVCMVIQARILFLRSSEMQDPIYRRAAITILLVSTLFFFCHILWISGMAFSALYFGFNRSIRSRPSDLLKGELVAVGQFILPLTNSFIYPLILILRKPDLRERYLGYLRRVLPVWNRAQETDTEHLVQPL